MWAMIAKLRMRSMVVMARCLASLGDGLNSERSPIPRSGGATASLTEPPTNGATKHGQGPQNRRYRPAQRETAETPGCDKLRHILSTNPRKQHYPTCDLRNRTLRAPPL